MGLEEEKVKFNQLKKDLSRLAVSAELLMEDKYMAQVYLSALLGDRLNQTNQAFELIDKYKQTTHIFK